MRNFQNYLTDKRIITELCKLRVKLANNRDKKHRSFNLSNSNLFNFHLKEVNQNSLIGGTKTSPLVAYSNDIEINLSQLLPPRRQWVKIGKKERYNKIDGNLISSNQKNVISLIKTIEKYKKLNPQPDWIKNLFNFTKELRLEVKNGKYNFDEPIIYPKLKSNLVYNGINPCRPISLYNLRDRILLSILNRYLSKLLDSYFSDSSFAFRTKKSAITSKTLTHHDCIYEILNLQKSNDYRPFWVVECDMEKFFDTVNHEVVLKLFDVFISNILLDHPLLDIHLIRKLFSSYLESYCFNETVPKPDNLAYWKSYKITNGEFEWVENKLIKLGYYDNINNNRIGIPQGGALSGLIANIVLDYADRKVLEIDVNYYRFCDDMIIINDNFEKCNLAKIKYLNALHDLKLVPHEFVSNNKFVELKIIQGKPKISYSQFWKHKSKGPYCWASLEIRGFPWIGFVGYEIKFNGSIRVRKKSFEKEINKQNLTLNKIVKLAKSGQRKGKKAFYESLSQRLIGMSVGKFELRNYKDVSSKLCWKNGFKALTKNKHSTKQIKQLDRNRNKILYQFKHWVRIQEWPEIKVKSSKTRQIIKYNKPYSYYFHLFENNRAT